MTIKLLAPKIAFFDDESSILFGWTFGIAFVHLVDWKCNGVL
jgi:hypothetical protein